MTILCTPVEPPAPELTAALPQPLVVVGDLAAARAAIGTDDDQVIVLGPQLELPDVVSFLESECGAHPALDVVVVRDALTLSDVRLAIRAGARDLLETADVAGLHDVCARLTERAGRRRGADDDAGTGSGRGKVITVFSAKGGAGKTTVATNLAATLNNRGKTRVCLVDLDLEFGDVAITLRLEPRVTLTDALEWDGFQPDLVPELLTAAGPRWDCLLAPVGPGRSDDLPAALTGQILVELASRYEYVVVDTAAAFTDHVLAALDVSDHQVLITAPELPSLKNLRLALDTLDLLGYRKDIRSLVVNRADVKSGLTAAELEGVTMVPLAAHLPSTADVSASINRGVPLVIEQPEHPFSWALRRLAAERLGSGEILTGKHRPSVFRLRRRSAA